MATVATPVGPFTVIVADPAGEATPEVLASGWTADPADLLPLINPALRPADPRPVRRIEAVTDRILAYHEGELDAVDDVPVHQRGGEFLAQAWQLLRALPPGAPVTYPELAAKAGRPGAVRAAGSACSRNAAALFVPCHRVVPAGGGVGGFRWGPDIKRWLLQHEAAAALV
jgi:methylated-DNA-[protein]-cysteine S-methyltransferase